MVNKFHPLYPLQYFQIHKNVFHYHRENEKGETLVKCSIFPDDESLKEHFGESEYTDDDLQSLFADVVKEVNHKLPAYKHIRGFKLRKSEFLKSASKKILRFKDENFTDGSNN